MKKHVSHYQKTIDNIRPAGTEAIPARVIEAYMRLEHGTLDHLSPLSFACAMRRAIAEINRDGLALAERVAAAEGFGPKGGQ